MKSIMEREEVLTVFAEYVEFLRVDDPAGDLQVDPFCRQPLQPGQQSPALRRNTPSDACCHATDTRLLSSRYVLYNIVAIFTAISLQFYFCALFPKRCYSCSSQQTVMSIFLLCVHKKK